MGDFRVRKIKDEHDRKKMYQYALNDIEAFEYMLKEKMFVDGDPWIGAEQELCIVDNKFDPTVSALKLLDEINDEHYTNELALFNMEINLDPLPLDGDCFSKMETSLLKLLNKGYTEADIDKYLSIIEKRVEAEVTGSSWAVKNFRTLSKHYGEAIAEKELVRQSLKYQKENIPLYDWEDIAIRDYKLSETDPTVEQLMSTNILSVHENDSIEIVKSILSWNNIHHLPVESRNGDLIGLITDGIIARLEQENTKSANFAKDIMLTNLITIQSHDSMKSAKSIFENNKITGLPVTYEKKLVGMLTLTDLAKCESKN